MLAFAAILMSPAALAPSPAVREAASQAAPMPDYKAARRQVVENDSALFWAAFEGCEPAALEDLLTEDFRMLHDLAGLAVTSRADFIASLERQCAARSPGGENDGYRNRRLATPGTRIVRPLGDWGVLEEGTHGFYEWRGEGIGWVMTGGARYMHVWQWMPEEGRFRLSESLSYDHGAPVPYPPGEG